MTSPRKDGLNRQPTSIMRVRAGEVAGWETFVNFVRAFGEKMVRHEVMDE